MAIVLGITACQKNTTQIATSGTSANPADGNLAPVESQPVSQAVPASQASYPAGYSYDNSQYAYDSGVDTQEPPVYALEPPPPLPEYSQPPCPAENEIWTPGYWDYSSAGYYWVPGAWVLAPYVGALWTPPYWAYESGRYRLHHGYWAPHIGFYGGIYYGFGYIGHGYYGGYWRDRVFNYNRAVTNVNVNIIRNVYTYNMRVNNITRISYDGGKGGIQARPIPAELAVLQERRVPPVAAQIQHAREAASDRAQFVQVNRGRPAMMAAARPLPTAYHAPAAPPPPPPQPRPGVANRENPPGAITRTENRSAPEGRPAPNPAFTRNEARPVQEGRPATTVPVEHSNPPFTRNERAQQERPKPAPAETKPEPRVMAQPQARPEAPARIENRPEPQPRVENRTQPQPRIENRPEPQQRIENLPHNRPAPENRLVQQPPPRVESRPAAQPSPRVEAHPAPAPPHAGPEPRSHPKDTRH